MKLKYKIVEFEPGLFHLFYKDRWFWHTCYEYPSWYDDGPLVYKTKQEAEKDLVIHRNMYLQELERKKFIPQEWLYPPNKVKGE